MINEDKAKLIRWMEIYSDEYKEHDLLASKAVEACGNPRNYDMCEIEDWAWWAMNEKLYSFLPETQKSS
jgi:hypothetical protein